MSVSDRTAMLEGLLKDVQARLVRIERILDEMPSHPYSPVQSPPSPGPHSAPSAKDHSVYSSPTPRSEWGAD